MYKEIKYVWRNQDLSSHLNILELLQWAVYLADFKMNLFLNVFICLCSVHCYLFVAGKHKDSYVKMTAFKLFTVKIDTQIKI